MNASAIPDWGKISSKGIDVEHLSPSPGATSSVYAGVFGPISEARGKLGALVPAPRWAIARRGDAERLDACESGPDLLRRMFVTDVLSCPCGGRRSVVAVIVDAARARALLAALGLPCTPATFAPARDPPQGELRFDDAP